MKNQFKVINLGLNELGVKEFNTHYKVNIEKGWVHKVKLGDRVLSHSKIFKNEKSFLNLKGKNYLGSVDITSCETGRYFKVLLEHVNYKIIKIVMVEEEFDLVF